MTDKALNCIVCKMNMKNLPSGETNHPSSGIVFTARGNYGSRVFDPMDHTYLEVNICDECIVTAKADKMVMLGELFPGERKLRLWV